VCGDGVSCCCLHYLVGFPACSVFALARAWWVDMGFRRLSDRFGSLRSQTSPASARPRMRAPYACTRADLNGDGTPYPPTRLGCLGLLCVNGGALVRDVFGLWGVLVRDVLGLCRVALSVAKPTALTQ